MDARPSERKMPKSLFCANQQQWTKFRFLVCKQFVFKIKDGVTGLYSSVKNKLVNRHQDKAITADILSTSSDFGGKAEASVVNSTSLTDSFTIDKKNEYLPVTKEAPVNNNKITYSFPAHSFTQIKVSVKEK